MKNNQLTGILVGALLLSTLASAAIVFKWDSYYRRSRDLQMNLGHVQEASTLMQQLVGETVDFAKNTGNKDLLNLLNTPVGVPARNAAPAKPVK